MVSDLEMQIFSISLLRETKYWLLAQGMFIILMTFMHILLSLWNKYICSTFTFYLFIYWLFPSTGVWVGMAPVSFHSCILRAIMEQMLTIIWIKNIKCVLSFSKYFFWIYGVYHGILFLLCTINMMTYLIQTSWYSPVSVSGISIS